MSSRRALRRGGLQRDWVELQGGGLGVFLCGFWWWLDSHMFFKPNHVSLVVAGQPYVFFQIMCPWWWLDSHMFFSNQIMCSWLVVAG